MMRMHQGGHTGHMDHAVANQSDAESGPAEHDKSCAGHASSGVGQKDGKGRTCCTGAACQCGCVLPPFVAEVFLFLTPLPLTPSLVALRVQPPTVQLGTTPFRPPAV